MCLGHEARKLGLYKKKEKDRMGRAQHLREREVGHDTRDRKDRPVRALWAIIKSLDFILKGL